MSKSPFMIDCPSCSSKRPEEIPGFINRYFGKNNSKIVDICDRCGGSGRIAVSTEDSRGEYKATRRLSKIHKIEMRKWTEMQKELIYGKAERLE